MADARREPGRRAAAPILLAAVLTLGGPGAAVAAGEDPGERGALLLREGRLAEARDLLEEAVAGEPERLQLHLLLAAAALRLGDLRSARIEIERVLEADPGNAAARELSGDAHYREGSLNLAAGEWERAAGDGGGHSLRAKLERVRRDIAAEQGLEREASRNFIVLYDAGVPREMVRGFFAALDGAFEELHDRLGESPRDDITAILYSRAAFRDVTRAPEWSGGIYDGKIRVPVGGLASLEEAAGLLGVLRHEMTHAFLHRLAPEGLPRWFNEGLATLVQGWQPEGARAYLAEHAPGAFPSLPAVDRSLLGLGGDVRAGYAAALLAVAEIEQMRGAGAVRGIVEGVGAGRPFAEVLADEARVSVAELEDRWRRALP